jgi:pimeloyl-ACP methyl ester carboxylesterase
VGTPGSIDTGHVDVLDIGGVPLAVRSWGEPSGRPVVFWHPLGDVTSGAYLTEMAPALTARGLRLLAPDGPGFGASPARPVEQYAVPRLAELVWGLVDTLGLDRPVLMGHSWGGVVMLAAAAHRPRDVSALVLLDSGQVDYADRSGTHPEWSLEERDAANSAGQPAYADRDDLLRQIQHDLRRPVTAAYGAGLEPALRLTSTGGLEPVATTLTRAAAQHAMLQERSMQHWPTLAAADVRVLLLLASEPEPVRRANDAAAGAVRSGHPKAAVHTLPGWGHDLIGDGGPELAAIIGDWLTGDGRGQPAASASSRVTSRTDASSSSRPEASTT